MVAFSCGVHQTGHFQGLPIYEGFFPSMHLGYRTSLKARVLTQYPGGAICRSMIYQKEFRLVGDIPAHQGILTLLNVVFQRDHRGSVLTADSDSWILPIRPITSQTMMELTETCTGIGALGFGSEFAGWKVVACNELQPKMSEVLRRYMSGTIVEGSIEHMHVVAELHKASGGSTSWAFGFSCQPFSRAGDRRGGQDIRSMTLPWGLWASYMLNCPIVVLECVSDAPKYPFVKLALQQFEEVTQHVKSEVVLELNALMPARRERWWCVLSASWIGRITLPELPSLATAPTVSDMFEQLPIPSKQTSDNMTLKDHEIRCLSQISVPIEQSLVNLHAPLPTALHSWSNQFHACPCECRNVGLSTTRLSNKGFFGVLVSFADETGQICYRHLTPQEVGILNGLPLFLGKHPNSRLEMAGVGQMASPIQSGWIFSAIRRHIGELGISHLPRIAIRDPLEKICRQIFRIRNTLWPALPVSVAMKLYEQNVMGLFVGPSNDSKMIPPQDVSDSSQVGHAVALQDVAISPTLEWPQTPGALPGFGIPGAKAEVEKDDSYHEPRVPRDRSRSPNRNQAESSVVPVQVETANPDFSLQPDLKQQSAGLSSFRKAMHSVGSVYSPGQEPQKAWDYISTPPQVCGLIDGFQDSVSSDVANTSSLKLGFGLSPTDLLSDKVVIIDFRHSQISAIATRPETTIADLQLAETSLGHPPFKCQDVFGKDLSQDVMLKSQQVVVVTTQDKIEDTFGCNKHPRAFSVFTQGTSVAQDEMDFYLLSIHRCRHTQFVKSLYVPYLEDVKVASSAWFSDIQFQVSKGPVISAILLGSHWIPVFVVCDDTRVVVTTTQEGVDAWQTLGLDPNFLHSSPPLPLLKVFEHDCGFQAFAWLVSQTYSEVDSTSFTPAFAKQWRILFWISVIICPSRASSTIPIALGGHNPEMQTAVAAILREHGVPIDQAASRATEILQALGSDRIAQCLHDVRPWASLKQLANRHQPPLRLITPGELQKLVEARGNKKAPVGNKTNKVNPGTKVNQCVLHPADIVIPVGVFTQADGIPIGQIPSSQVGSNSRGLVVLSEMDFMPFAQQTLISTEGLAFAILEPSQPFVEQFGGLTRFPAKCSANGEPMLITAAIVQKGQKPIQRATPPQLPAVVEVPVVTVKMMLYRDQCTAQWSTILEGPVKHLLQLAPCLSVCRNAECSCPASHVNNGEAEPILDLWNRDFVTTQFRKTSPKDAEIFTCHVRILQSVFEALTAVSGIAGLFIEPRAADGRGHCPQHHTVWLPKASHSDVMQMKQQAKAPAFVVRVAQRYGLKTSVSNASAIHEQFRQDTPFVAGHTTMYVVGPLPWGCTRHTLQKLISSWNWPAKAIQPAGRSADGLGILWHAQASQPPQHPVITMSHGDVLIVAKDNQASKPQRVAIEASSHTKECLTAASKEAKPLDTDPWAAAAAKLPQRHPPGLTPVQVQQLEDRIDRKFASCISSSDGDSLMQESLEPRVKALENQIAKLGEAQTQQVLNTQALSSKVSQVQQQVEHQGAQFRNHLDTQLADQMSKIEALLNKRPRNE